MTTITMTIEWQPANGMDFAVLRFFNGNDQQITSATAIVRSGAIDAHVRRVEAAHGPVVSRQVVKHSLC